MAKAAARLSPRQVLGNRKSSLSIGEAAAALVAMLAGARGMPPRAELRRMASAALERQQYAQRSAEATAARKRQEAAAANEFASAITVWTGLPVKARSGKITAQVSALQQRLASLQQAEVANV